MSSLGFPTLVAAFVKHYLTNVVGKNLGQELRLTKKILSPPDRYPPAFTVVSSNKKCSAWRYHHRHRDCEDGNYQGSLEKSREKHRWIRRWSSPSNTDRITRTPKSKLSASSASSRLRSEVSNRQEFHAFYSKEKLETAHQVNYWINMADNYHTNRLGNTSTKYNQLVSKFLAKMAKQKKAQLKPHFFNWLNTMSTTRCLENLKLACDTKGVHEGANR